MPFFLDKITTTCYTAKMEERAETPKTPITETSFVQIPGPLWLDLKACKLECNDLVVFGLLKSRAIEKKLSWPSIGTLARESRQSVSSIQRCLRRLRRAGHIERRKGPKSAITVLLTDVEDGNVVRRNPRAIAGPAKPRLTCKQETPFCPEPQEMEEPPF